MSFSPLSSFHPLLLFFSPPLLLCSAHLSFSSPPAFFLRPPLPFKVYECFNPAACAGASRNVSAASTSRRQLSTNSASTAGDSLCADGHMGFLCGTCVDGWYGYKDSTPCAECSGSMGLSFVPIIIFSIVAVVAIVFFCRGGNLTGGVDMTMALKEGLSEAVEATVDGKTNNVVGGARATTRKEKAAAFGLKAAGKIARLGVKLKILLSLWQILQGISANFDIPFPALYESIVSSVGGLLQIELPSLMPLDCVVRTTYYSKLIFKCARPSHRRIHAEAA